MNSSHRGKLAAIALVMAATLFVCVNIISNNSFRAFQLDLTEGKLFTLSKETARVIGEI